MEEQLNGFDYDKIINLIISVGSNLAMAIAILVIGFWVVKKIMKVVELSLEKAKLSPEISSFLLSLLSGVMKIFILLAAIGKVGVDTASLVGLIAAAGFAVGMALQGSLGNFAAGIMILIFKPYKLGDWVEVSEKFGMVESIQIFNTTIVTPGQKTHIIPNGQVMEGVITNFSQKGHIRLELNIAMAYEESFPKVKEIIRTALKKVPSILQDVEADIGIESYDTHSIILAVRPFIKPDDYWKATYDCYAAIKKELSENKIKMAYSEGVELGPIGE
ncbi:MAG TPA: mechanosensitive ion channel [Phaeodactylibacter sp.]|nr:mechanosensitive ion channel [Phaeodactylibacter sp.]